MPHDPQLAASSPKSMHRPPHSPMPLGHPTHAPERHTSAPPQARPHAPQLAWSLATFTPHAAAPQVAHPAAHSTSHRPPAQYPAPVALDGH